MAVNEISDDIKIKFLGGTGEVGRSAITVKSSKTQILLDYGVMLNHEPGFPMHISPREVNAIILSHAHLDHSGSIPIFHVRGHTPVYGTPPTFDFTKLLISDLIRVSGYYLPYEYIDLENMLSCYVKTGYREPIKIGDLEVELLNAGHIPGGAQTIVSGSEKRILYTSDINAVETRLLEGADQSYDGIDTLITESTYAYRDHVDRSEVEKRFMERVRETVEGGGIVLVPALSVGRSQEILLILNAHNFEYPVIVDGMAEDANEILFSHPDYLRDPKLFAEAMQKTHWVKGWRERRLAIKKPGVIVSPAGMLKGGHAIFYMNKVAKKGNNAIFLVSYQIPGTPGRKLLETKKFILNGKIRKVEADVEHFDFTSHSGRKQLLETAKRSGCTKAFTIHGAEENCQVFASLLKDELGIDAVAPKPGDVFKV